MVTPGGSPPPPDVFEFFHGVSSGDTGCASEMCAAEDIFFQGRLVPSNPFLPPQRQPQPRHRRNKTEQPLDSPLRRHRRSVSHDEVGGPGGGASAKYLMLRRASSDSGPPPPRATKPRPGWYLFVFGSFTVPAAMEMKDIRTRQRRLTPRPLAAAAAAETGRRGCEARSSRWRIIRSLSCKAVDSATTVSPMALA